MIANLFKKMFGSKNDRELKRMSRVVEQVNALEESIHALDDTALAAKTVELRQQLEDGATLEDLLPEAFACVRESSRRTLGLRHFDVQILGGITLHEGRIAEMRTGEGKTLVATLPVYLNALTGRGVYVVTVNDYLAERDANWMRPVYEFLGLSVGIVRSGQSPEEKRAAYLCDITYGTNNEFGFDYLRDNMAFSIEDRFQRELYFAIVDEVDSILIDEARTPLIISGPAEDSSKLYKRINQFIPRLQPIPHPDQPRNHKIETAKVLLRPAGGGEPELLSTTEVVSRALAEDKHLVQVATDKHPVCEILEPGHYTIDEKQRSAELTENGHQFIESLLIDDKLLDEGDSLYSAGNLNLLHHVQSALRAHVLFRRDVEYIVQNGQVVLIDEHTGRTMEGRRLSEGLHQALEAKENVKIQAESQTLASTTFQNYFRLFDKLAGMTGTADTEAYEFNEIYGLDVVVIPTNMPNQRTDHNDLVYLTREEKFEAIVEEVKRIVETGAPILVGTASIETSEEMSRRFKTAGIGHKVLNAKYHQQEAEIIAQAGRPGVVTIATNMAGRGTDIVLGGNVEAEIAANPDLTPEQIQQLREEQKQRQQQVLDSGGLHIVGTERHESRRIDNQLRGRAGRQGDPGQTRFFLSLEDDLMRIFASDRVRGIMQALGLEKGEAIEHKMVTNAIEKAQRKVEGRNFDIRKQLLEYDDVANDQRQIIYEQRRELLEAEDIADMLVAIREDVVNDIISEYIPLQSIEDQWDIAGLEQRLETDFELSLPIAHWLEDDDQLAEEGLRERVVTSVQEAYERKCEQIGPVMRKVECHIMLQVLDTLWKEHLATMDHLRQGIHLRAFAQKNPKQEYKREAFDLFETMLENLKFEVIRFLAHVQVQQNEDVEALEEERRREEAEAAQSRNFNHPDTAALSPAQPTPAPAPGSAPGAPARPTAQPVAEGEQAQPFIRSERKVGRNEPCPCGSGKKYKQCHGKISA